MAEVAIFFATKNWKMLSPAAFSTDHRNFISKDKKLNFSIVLRQLVILRGFLQKIVSIRTKNAGQKRDTNNQTSFRFMANIGRIKQIIGAVVDVDFSARDSKLPEISTHWSNPSWWLCSCFGSTASPGEDGVRTIAMDSTDGLTRGMECVDTGTSIAMPVGEAVRGRLFNVVGEAIDGIGEVKR